MKLTETSKTAFSNTMGDIIFMDINAVRTTTALSRATVKTTGMHWLNTKKEESHTQQGPLQWSYHLYVILSQ